METIVGMTAIAVGIMLGLAANRHRFDGWPLS